MVRLAVSVMALSHGCSVSGEYRPGREGLEPSQPLRPRPEQFGHFLSFVNSADGPVKSGKSELAFHPRSSCNR